jgi:hypothetical protein
MALLILGEVIQVASAERSFWWWGRPQRTGLHFWPTCGYLCRRFGIKAHRKIVRSYSESESLSLIDGSIIRQTASYAEAVRSISAVKKQNKLSTPVLPALRTIHPRIFRLPSSARNHSEELKRTGKRQTGQPLALHTTTCHHVCLFPRHHRLNTHTHTNTLLRDACCHYS